MQAQGVHPIWRSTEPWPTTLIAYRKGQSAPSLEETLASLAMHLDETVELLEILGSQDDKHPFSAIIRVPGMDVPVYLACEKAKGNTDSPAELQPALGGCAWVLIAETLLDPDEPLKTYSDLARIITHDPEVVAVMDGTTGLWSDRATIDRDLLDDSVPPPERYLWQTRVVSASQDLNEGTAWILTNGLLRSGRPDLEMLEIPSPLIHDAVGMIDIAAGLLLEGEVPIPEVPWKLGEGIDVVLIPWKEVIETINPDALGSLDDREQLGQETPNPLMAIRAVLCAVDMKGSFRQIRTWPEQALKMFSSSDAMVHTSTYGAERASALARRSWPLLIEAWERHCVSNVNSPVVLVGVPVGKNPDGNAEHGWIQLDRLDSEGGSGKLLRNAITGRAQGSRIEFAIDDVGGWRIIDGERSCGHGDEMDPSDFLEGRS